MADVWRVRGLNGHVLVCFVAFGSSARGFSAFGSSARGFSAFGSSARGFSAFGSAPAVSAPSAPAPSAPAPAVSAPSSASSSSSAPAPSTRGASGGSASTGHGQYTVRAGDTLSGIAAHLRITGGWHALYHKNHKVVGGNPNLIAPGQKLTY